MVGSGSCGIPCPFRECRIVDEDGTTVPPGEVGELLLRGPGMLQGYYRKPGSDRRQRSTATGSAPAICSARTSAATSTSSGRMKDMIRRAGENIAAREVEAVLLAMPEIAEAAAVPVPDETRGEEVKAYIVLQPGGAATTCRRNGSSTHCEARLAPLQGAALHRVRDQPAEDALGQDRQAAAGGRAVHVRRRRTTASRRAGFEQRVHFAEIDALPGRSNRCSTTEEV